MMPEISICMVSLNCRYVIVDCLESLRAINPSVHHEIIVVDNGSTDGTVELLKQCFPEVHLIENGSNVGFTRATNEAIKVSKGRYLLWLNTDTILTPAALTRLYQFMEADSRIGIAGPKVLNPDGSFQPQCRRGMPTPLASLCYMLKLDRLWPQNPSVGQYLMTHLPEDVPNQVDAVSGCCLMARREVWESIGALDEHIFAYGEDIDWCVRAKKADWQVWYYPASVITHLKGQGGAHAKPFHKVWGLHAGMWVFYRKHLKSQYPMVITALVWLGIQGKMLLSATATGLRRCTLIRRTKTGKVSPRLQ